MVEKSVQVDGLRIRYIEGGTGPAVLLIHGASLGSSADVFERNLISFRAYGLRTIAFDQPGFGLSDNPRDYSVKYRQHFILKLMDALEINKAHLVGHSQAGAMAVGLAFDHPQRISKIVVVGTGSLLPPLSESSKRAEPREGEEGTNSEATLENSRALLEHDLYNHSLITPHVLATRHRMSIGKNFEAFLERRQAGRNGGCKVSVPIWESLEQLPVPLMLIYGKQDLGSAVQRATLAKERYPNLNLHMINYCKHLIQWDAATEFEELCRQFLVACPATQFRLTYH